MDRAAQNGEPGLTAEVRGAAMKLAHTEQVVADFGEDELKQLKGVLEGHSFDDLGHVFLGLEEGRARSNDAGDEAGRMSAAFPAVQPRCVGETGLAPPGGGLRQKLEASQVRRWFKGLYC